MKRVRSPLVGTLVLLILVVWTSAATGVGPPFERAFTTRNAYPDTLGTGTATAQSTADVSGALSAAVSATSDLPAGVLLQLGGWYKDIGIGGSEAAAHAGVDLYFRDLPAGTHTITAVFDNVRSKMRLSPVVTNFNLNGYGTLGGSGHTEAVLALYYYPCQQTEYCSATYWDHTWQWLLGNSGVNGDFQGKVTLSRTFTTAEKGRVWVQAYFFAAAVATGEDASAYFDVSGQVTRIDLT